MDDSLLPVTSLHHKLNQADLAFLIFVQRNKINPALCKMPITDPQYTIWTGDSFPQQTNIWCVVHETKKEKAASLSQLTAFSYFTTCCTLAFSTSLPSTMVIPCL